MYSQDKCNYYLDFIIAPLLFLAALIIQLYYNGPSVGLLVAAAAGYSVWSLLEYWIHRIIFHRFMRREHWLHHLRPGGYVSTLNYVTTPIQVTVYGGLVGSLGMTYGTGLFLGLLAGYFAYIATHDRIHHGPRASAWLRWRAALHDLHHGGKEVNFGVVTSLWDRVFGTHLSPIGT